MNEWASQKNVLDKFQEKTQQHTTRIQRDGMYGWFEMWLLRATTTFIIRCRQRVCVCVCVPATLLIELAFHGLCSSSFRCAMQMENSSSLLCAMCTWDSQPLTIYFIPFHLGFLSFAIFIEIGLKNPAKSHTFIEHKLCARNGFVIVISHICESVSSFPLFLIRIRASGLFPFIRLIRSYSKSRKLSKSLAMNYCAYATKMMFLLKAFALFSCECVFCLLCAAKAKTMSNSKTNGYYEAYGYISFH